MIRMNNKIIKSLKITNKKYLSNIVRINEYTIKVRAYTPKGYIFKHGLYHYEIRKMFEQDTTINFHIPSPFEYIYSLYKD